jgi:hypothetical protein
MGIPTYLPIASITLGSAAASVTFSGITQQYRDLVLVISANSTTTNALADILYRFNGDSGANYNKVGMYGAGSASGSFSGLNETSAQFAGIIGNAGGTTKYSPATLNIMDYSASDKHKTTLSRYGDTTDAAVAMAQRWASNSAVTSILLLPSAGSFNTGSTFTLYGVIA